MSERKVLNKYYPPDFDPSKIPRLKKKDKKSEVRIMAPFNMRCTSCDWYIANATKFNAKKEAVIDETYNSLTIFRFYIRCPGCLNTIIFRTNLKDHGYEVEKGATENFKSLKMAEKQAKEEAEAEEEEEKINPMKHLENRTKASKQQMEASEQIHNLKSIKYKFHTVDLDALIREKRKEISEEIGIEPPDSDEDNRRKLAKVIMERKAIESVETSSMSKSIVRPEKISSVTNSKMSSSLSNLRKKIKVVPKSKQ